MANNLSPDPRALKTRQSLQKAFKEMLGSKPYHKINITDLTGKAGIARHTFYNHYETKQDLLNILIDSVLEDFFSDLENWDLLQMDQDRELSMYTSFFQAWKDHSNISNLLKNAELEGVIIERLKAFFTRLYHEKIREELPQVDLGFANYVISFNAYSLVGLLKPWVESGMKASPVDLGGFLLQLTGARRRLQAVQAYQHILSE
jgi:AcrR family transcriptional regulator